jgi:TonB family protein
MTITRLQPGLEMEILPAAPVAPPPGPATSYGDLVEYTRLDTVPRAIATVSPEYPRLALKLQLEGKVVLNVLVMPDGEVSAVHVLSGPHAVLQKAAADAVRMWHYTAPMKDGLAVRTWKREVIVFKR